MTESDQHPSAKEHPGILRIDAEARAFLEVRREFLRPHKPGWWRNLPNPHAVGNQVNEDEL